MEININQEFCLNNDLSITQYAVLFCIKNLEGKVKKLSAGSDTYYFITRSKIIDSLPAFGLKDSTVYQYLRILKDKELVESAKFQGLEYIRAVELNDKDLDFDKFEKEQEVLDYLNKVSGKSFKLNASTLGFIRARFKDKYNIEDFKRVIDKKCKEWKNNPVMEKYIRPQTLFNKTKFESYVEENMQLNFSEKDKVKELLGL